MKALKALVGLTLLIAGTASLGEERPISRDQGMQARLASVRPNVRPPYMVRYPVEIADRTPDVRPQTRDPFLPRARWDFKDAGRLWTRAGMSAIETQAPELLQIVPEDIENWCPAYTDNAPALRQAFWVGMMSALSKHESTYNPNAVGGGDQWYGLLQIYPDTASRYGCRAQTGEALKDPADNLSCAARIMSVTVVRDNAVAVFDGRWRGVAADWGPMSNRSKISEMSDWTRGQRYCRPLDAMRPIARPSLPEAISTKSESSGPDLR